MRLSVRHAVTVTVSPAAPGVAVRLKMFPSAFEGQRSLAWRVLLNGEAAAPDFVNGWGDGVATRFLRGGVTELEIVAAGEIETTDCAGVLRGFRAPLRPGVCLRETPRTRPDAAIAAMAKEAVAGAATPLECAHALQDAVTRRIAPTGAAHPTAAAALSAGEGGADEIAHVLIAAARSMGWPARFVYGYRLADAPEEALEEDEAGEGASDKAEEDAEGEDAAARAAMVAALAQPHGWAELWVEGIGWIGFDAAHDLCPTDAYVRLCSGLDAVDAAPLRVHAEGGAETSASAEVDVSAGGSAGGMRQAGGQTQQ